jgi:hypothetical protein
MRCMVLVPGVDGGNSKTALLAGDDAKARLAAAPRDSSARLKP